jgi:acetoin utilization protein AcuC
MSTSVHVPWDDDLVAYDFGPTHPMAPLRVELAMRLAEELGVFALPNVTRVPAPVAGDDVLRLVHTADYVATVREVSERPRPAEDYGLGTEDDPVFAGMHEAAARIVGASVAAAESVWSGRAEHAVNLAGGLHHAMPGAASGFCVYNDVAVAIARMLEMGADRVAYVDVDVHHGDGVQQVFWDDPRVLTISVHESGRALFPGTGYPEETGAPGAEGTAVNLALPPGTGDNGWLRAFGAVVPALVRAFEPKVLVSQQGCDTHFLDPLAHLTLSVDGQRATYAALHDLAHRHAGGRWVAFGGGGYEVVDVVPRAWTHLLAEAAGHPVPADTPTPQAWRDYVQARVGRTPPARMTDGREPTPKSWSRGYDPGDWLDRCVMATRAAVFPAHGLDPMLDL